MRCLSRRIKTVLSSPFVRSHSPSISSVNHTPYSPGKKTRSRTIINHGLVVSATRRHSHLERNEPWLPIYVLGVYIKTEWWIHTTILILAALFAVYFVENIIHFFYRESLEVKSKNKYVLQAWSLDTLRHHTLVSTGEPSRRVVALDAATADADVCTYSH